MHQISVAPQLQVWPLPGDAAGCDARAVARLVSCEFTFRTLTTFDRGHRGDKNGGKGHTLDGAYNYDAESIGECHFWVALAGWR
jgi:hypothetical protein